MADANAILKRVVSELSEDQKDVFLHTANKAGEILSACILAEAIIKLGESIERAADKLKMD